MFVHSPAPSISTVLHRVFPSLLVGPLRSTGVQPTDPREEASWYHLIKSPRCVKYFRGVSPSLVLALSTSHFLSSFKLARNRNGYRPLLSAHGGCRPPQAAPRPADGPAVTQDRLCPLAALTIALMCCQASWCCWNLQQWFYCTSPTSCWCDKNGTICTKHFLLQLPVNQGELQAGAAESPWAPPQGGLPAASPPQGFQVSEASPPAASVTALELLAGTGQVRYQMVTEKHKVNVVLLSGG